MADNTAIEWTDATWNPITGCSVVSPGCTNCYAMKLAGTRLKHVASRKGLTRDSKAGPVWTGEVRFNEAELLKPLRWKRPRKIFVCAHGDLFHESVPDDWIDRVFAVMAVCPQHAFQVLTKRSARMRAYLSDPGRFEDRILDQVAAMSATTWGDGNVFGAALPLPNVWLGVSAEDHARADERIPDLLATPAAIRWLSAEPLLGPINLFSTTGGTLWMGGQRGCDGEHRGIGTPDCPRWPHHHHDERCGPGLDWVVAGGEGGPAARPMKPQWARDLRDQCASAEVAFLFKQNGEWVSVSEVEGPGDHYSFEDGATVRRTGKKLAGRTLDGQVHDAYPDQTRHHGSRA